MCALAWGTVLEGNVLWGIWVLLCSEGSSERRPLPHQRPGKDKALNLTLVYEARVPLTPSPPPPPCSGLWEPIL